jgi:O-antigen ligase
MLSRVRNNRLLLATGALFLALATVHIPISIFPHAFDKNSSVEFLTLILIAVLFAFVVLAKRTRFIFSGRGVQAIWILLAAVAISTALSSDPISSLTGDSGRYAGVISLLCLLVVAIYHAQFSENQIKKLITLYLGAVWVVAILGILQHFKVVDFPGDIGVTSTLGNMDFFAAFIGTSFPLFLYLLIESSSRARIFIGLGAFTSLYALYIPGRRQAFVDLALTLLFFLIYLGRRFIPRFYLTLNAKTAFLTLGFIIWIEGIFLMPFIGKSIPLLGNDGQVQIRGRFWVAALNQFMSHPLFGVGPDQYGNYYEQYRTLEDVKLFPTILSNDAHASTVQSLATLGIVGALAFILLLIVLVRSILILMARNPERKKYYGVLTLYFIIFLTNSAVSPITLPNKFIFWALAGYVVGSAYRSERTIEEPAAIRWNAIGIQAVIAIAAIASLFVGVNFAGGQLNYMKNFERHFTQPTAKISYIPSAWLPCPLFYENEFKILENQGVDALTIYAKKRINQHPRCVGPRLFLAKVDYNQGNLTDMGKQISALSTLAPSRLDFLTTANAYAARIGDTQLQRKIVIQMEKAGIITFVQKSDTSTAKKK